MRAYHKNYISNVVIYTMGYVLVDNVDNGGVAVKIEFSRYQSNEVTQKMQRVTRRDEATGKLVYNGKTLHRNGALYLVDCNMTGSSCGMTDDPSVCR